jgi:anti-anti-sigma regulatory factor
MALFSKPPAKKSGPVPAPRAASARDLAAHAESRKSAHARPVTEPTGVNTATGASIIDWSPAYASIEVLKTNPGLCGVLENAALLYAGGQAATAREQLEAGVQSDLETKQSPLAWLALFDLIQRACDRQGFDKLAMDYVVQFERSAPAWEEPAAPKADINGSHGGFVALAGKLSAAGGPQWLGLRRAIETRVPQARLDLSAITSYDDAGARLLAGLLAEARRAHVALTIERPEKLQVLLGIAIRKGREGGQGAWLLALEMMQWRHDQAAFDDSAVDFAVAFEVSPPSWEPPPEEEEEVVEAPAAPAVGKRGADAETFPCAGVLAGPNAPLLNALSDFSHRRDLIVVDMSEVERIDFACAGALLNSIGRIETQRKTVQIVGASPIIRALLLLIGISPRHFVKKSV